MVCQVSVKVCDILAARIVACCAIISVKRDRNPSGTIAFSIIYNMLLTLFPLEKEAMSAVPAGCTVYRLLVDCHTCPCGPSTLKQMETQWCMLAELYG